MENPWKGIPLSDYEAHMSLDSVGQLQAMDRLMERQFSRVPARTALVFGVAGGNGVLRLGSIRRVYGVDVNLEYLAACEKRLAGLGNRFVPVLADVLDPDCALPQAELAIANLFVEYVGCAAFARAVRKVNPRWLSVGIQLNEGAGFVCDSPYLHSFDGLASIHVQVERGPLSAALETEGFHPAGAQAIPLPQGKTLLNLDFERA